MYSEDELIQISALQHFIFCERQCGLIHIERLWNENLLTAEGKIMHEHVDTANRESRGNVRIEFGMPIRSLRFGLIGKADVVEFHHQKNEHGDLWKPFPVEYKHGKPKSNDSDRIQLCAQAICLEEMLNIEVPEGALFYGETRHRHDVVFDNPLRQKTEETATKLRELLISGITPRPDNSPKCKQCSLVELCLPNISKNASSYLLKIIDEEYGMEP